MGVKGNQFWKLRAKHGRDKLFTTPDLLWEAACEYFQWCNDNPWVIRKLKEKSSGSEVESTPTERPYSLSGLCIFLGVNQAYFRQFKTTCDSDFSTVITRIEEVIETQQFEGATVGAFNANIIARKLGLSERTDVTSAGEKIETVNIKVIRSKEELNEQL